MKYAKLFVEKYNYKLPKKNQLKMSKLDDQVGDNLPNYVKIPREIIYNKELGDKRVIIFSYLCSRRALDDTVAFSISELCHWSYLKPNYHDGKINHKYLEMLELLSHYGYFESYPDFEKLAKRKKILQIITISKLTQRNLIFQTILESSILMNCQKYWILKKN